MISKSTFIKWTIFLSILAEILREVLSRLPE